MNSLDCIYYEIRWYLMSHGAENLYWIAYIYMYIYIYDDLITNDNIFICWIEYIMKVVRSHMYYKRLL